PTPHQQKVLAFRRRLAIHLGSSSNVPDPIPTFDSLPLPPHLAPLYSKICQNIESGSWFNPTPVQMQSIPVLSKGRDCIVQAKTGSGKTGAYALGLICRVMKKKSEERGGGGKGVKVRGLVLAPTQELASQIGREFTRLLSNTSLTTTVLRKDNSHLIVSGSSCPKGGFDIMVGTSGRVKDVRLGIDWTAPGRTRPRTAGAASTATRS
ncbi:hypothetical protein TrRE_jg864, partial [Triparma retinervis]